MMATFTALADAGGLGLGVRDVLLAVVVRFEGFPGIEARGADGGKDLWSFSAPKALCPSDIWSELILQREPYFSNSMVR